MSVFLFWGQEEYLLNNEVKKLKNELLDDSFISMAYKVFDNPSFNTLMDILQAAPLMFGATLSIVNLDKYLVGNKLSFTDKEMESIDFALKSVNEKVNIIFVCKIPRDENKKPDSRKKLYKIISKYSQVREFAQFKTYQKELNLQISKMAKEKDLIISSDNIVLLIEQLGPNLTLIDSELEKLKIALFPNKTVDTGALKKYCTSSEDVFLLADLIINGNKNEVIKQFNLLTEKRHPLEIFSVLQSNFQRFIYIKSYERKMSTKDISLNLKLHEYIVMKTQEKLRKISLDRLLQIRENLINAEYKLKTGQSADGEILLEMALLS